MGPVQQGQALILISAQLIFDKPVLFFDIVSDLLTDMKNGATIVVSIFHSLLSHFIHVLQERPIRNNMILKNLQNYGRVIR